MRLFSILRVKAASAFSAITIQSVCPSVCHTGGSVKNGAR